jgi:1,5-anhydro-D-fructose reductase (1,5-anhydro-D-mannitol-forming)
MEAHAVNTVRWGIVGCGNVTEVKSGPGFQKADGSRLVAVMRRDRLKAEDYARRHGVPAVHTSADALIHDPGVDAVYIATPPSSHLDLALRVAAAGKPCLVEKPMAMTHAECVRMNDAFRAAGVPLFVAYYRRALPRFLEVRRQLESGAIGPVTDVHVRIAEPLATGEDASGWRFDPAVAGAGLFYDLASHCLDLVDFLLGPIAEATGVAVNTGGAYSVEDVTAGAFRFSGGMVGTGAWNFNANRSEDWMVFTGPLGELRTPVFTDGDVVVRYGWHEKVLPLRNPPHVHQPLIQTIVDELRGRGRCESTGESGARASWVMDRLLEGYRERRQHPVASSQ